MHIFVKEFLDWKNIWKSLLGAITMSVLLVYENRYNSFEMYQIALCGQFIYSFMLGNFWMSLYQTGKFKLPKSIKIRGLISAFLTAFIAGVATYFIQALLMNPEALPTARWAFILSTFAFLFNESLCVWGTKKRSQASS